ncbi:hypothetical protein MgSA37_02874 [Mucilaginibacter gotjawali]|uniref:DUF4890 domain-containing protein n=1 Tax=Mucilaginibacter gotjawali TaxID=1550579 RepID=A0A0X8X2S9_9SPHI|nr:hypothetical protein [Mucilaginibacter gotjawali]BAU54696.1 hypothetical protein MgSA37_02874 [Mucilaginibacter gotjawali]
MKFINKLLAVLLLASAVVCSVNAQANLQKLKNETPEQRAAFQTKLMKEKLNLNDMQLTKVSTINLKYAEKFEPIIKSDDNRFLRMRQAKALMEQKDKELQAVFTKTQYNEYLAVENEIRKKSGRK